MSYFNDLSSANSLISAFGRVRKAAGWKYSEQIYECNLLTETWLLQKDIRSGKYEQKKGATFKLHEREHLRLVRALVPRDMVAQHSLVDEILMPQLQKYLIHDNGASIKGKGISFTRRRFEEQLRRFYRKHGSDGYVLLIDFRKFFDNIQHEPLVKAFEEKLPEKELIDFIRNLLVAYEVDVSYSEDEDIIHKVFNSLEYQDIPKEKLTGKRMMAKSIGIGAPVSQISGIFFPLAIDLYCKNVMRCHFYDVYMDDRVVIHQDKKFLRELLDDIEEIAQKLGLHINRNKTQIVKLSHGFTFLKTRYSILPTGRIIRRIPRTVVTRERRKLKKLAPLVVNGEMELKDFIEQYGSWRGDKKRYDAWDTLRKVDSLYRRLLKWISRNSLPRSSRKSAI